MSEIDESYSDNEQSNDGSSKRRTRVPNFTEKEKNLLAKIVESKMHIVGSKLTDTESCAKKKAAWAAVAEEFNRENYEYKREITSLRRLWDAMKIARRRESGLIGDSGQESSGKDRAPKVPRTRTKEEIIMVRGVPGVLFETEIEYDSEGSPATEAGRHSNTRRGYRHTDRDDNNTGRRRLPPRVPLATPAVRRTHDYMRREAMLRIKSLEAKKQMELQILKEKLEKEEIKKMAAKVELEAAEAKRDAAKLELEYQKNRLRGQVGPTNMYYN